MHHAHIDKFAYQDSAIHRLDSRVKFLVVLVFTAIVISLPRTSLSILVCYAIGPFAVLVWAGIPLRFVFKQIVLVSPFVDRPDFVDKIADGKVDIVIVYKVDRLSRSLADFIRILESFDRHKLNIFFGTDGGSCLLPTFRDIQSIAKKN